MAKRKDPPKRVPGQKSLASFVIAKDSRRAETKPASRPENPVALGTRVKIEHPQDTQKFIDGKIIAVTHWEGGSVTYRVQLVGDAAMDVDKHTIEWTHQQAVHGQLFAQAFGQKVLKDFDGTWFSGEVIIVWRDDDGALQFRILYEDGDSEDMDEGDYTLYRSHYENRNGEAHKTMPSVTIRSPNTDAIAQSRSHGFAADQTKVTPDKENETPDEESQRKSEKRKRIAPATVRSVKKRICSVDSIDVSRADSTIQTASSTGRAKRTRKHTFSYKEDIESDIDDEVETPSSESSTELDDISLTEDSEEVDDFIGQDMAVGKPRKAASRVVTDVPSTAAKTTKVSRTTRKMEKPNEADDSISTNQLKLQKLDEKMAAERKSFKAQNNPQVMPPKPFVDPVGIDPTHGIVEGIITEQVRKVGGLLKTVVERNESGQREKGELPIPIRLQTACSGTDAPSIALSIIRESLDHLYREKAEESHGFSFSHVMSCEIEPFKQAYIGRNFPGVPLFPDITKLTTEEQVIDVYGRPQTIPDGNLFVAGTSCKDFSMLKSNLRLDIEDKGTSGQTFLAAVEFLDKFKPEFFIFENVDGAPWDKMQEYITGRIQLARRDDTTAITSSKTIADACSQLKFTVAKDGRYVAEEIPRQVGIRAGSAVKGFVRIADSDLVRPITSSASEGSSVTLGQLAKLHKINLDKDVLVMDKETSYCTHLCKLDTKDYGLPQTRNRKYLFGWKSDDPHDDLGVFIDLLMGHLKTPLLYSMDAFLLPDTHDRIRCFREALRSGPGLMVKRERAAEPDFWDWPLSQNLDTPRHMVYREAYGIEERSRWITQWEPRGKKSLPPGCWPELFDCWNMRRLDLIDCFGSAAVRDPISRDPLHHSFVWDLSQNVTRTQYRTATVGVSGCVTPGGELFLPHRGRTLMGYEKLLLQGIPFSRLRLGHESEVQLSDLAGNAMSVSVISATLLAALCAPELRRQVKNSSNSATISRLLTDFRVTERNCQGQALKKDEAKYKLKMGKISDGIKDYAKPLWTKFRISQKHDEAAGGVLAERGDLHDRMDVAVLDDSFVSLLREIVRKFAKESYLSSVLCICESSGARTNNAVIMECEHCGMSICHRCSDRHQTESHKLKCVVDGKFDRPDPHAFEKKLRCAVPSLLRLGLGWSEAVPDAKGLESSYGFHLQGVERERGFWELVYGAWEDCGAGRQVAEIRVRLGRTGALQPLGAVALLRCFAPSIRQDKPHRGDLGFNARITVDASTEEACWETLSPETSARKINLAGRSSCPSHRVQVGLTDVACNALEKHIVKSAFKPQVPSRNSLTSYHKLWKEWPSEIEVSGIDIITGTYRRLPCRHTTVHSALWRRDGDGEKPSLYIFIRPDVVRSGLDIAVISRTPSHRDSMEVCELFDWIPENALVPKTQTTSVKMISWASSPLLDVDIVSPTITVSTTTETFNERVRATSAKNCETSLCRLAGLSDDLVDRLLECSSSTSATEEIDIYGKFGTRNAKLLSIVAAPSLEKYAASNSFPLIFSEWYRLPASWSFFSFEEHVPSRPSEKWKVPIKRGKELVYERFYDPEESHEYYQKLLQRPPPFVVDVDRSRNELEISMNPSVAAHCAVARLGGEKASVIGVEYCLAELSSMGEPGTKEFKVPNSDAFHEISLSGLKLPLYPRQSKALARMVAIEQGEVLFKEEERSEHILPGIGWCLIAKATKEKPLNGGVLGDAIGSGKTVITIALILQGVQKARKDRDASIGRSGASLVVVPPGLVQQWDDERTKFTGSQLTCIKIQSVAELKSCSVKQICEADVIIVPAGIIEEAPGPGPRRPYTEHLTSKAGLDLKEGKGLIPPAPTYYSQREAPTIEGTWVRNMASGPDIYVGNHGTQRKRDAQAYYSYCYHEAISALRLRKFGVDEKGVPLEYFEWERVIIDECHETLVTGKSHEVTNEDYKEKARRGAREFLGVAQTDPSKRPLIAARGTWGLTGTPLLETEARVTELANLMGGTYVTGACHHWRKEERESGRDLFLNQQEGSFSREYRCAVQNSCHLFVQEACQRNRGEALLVNLTRVQKSVNMSDEEGQQFMNGLDALQLSSYSISVDLLGDKVGSILPISAKSKARHTALREALDSILQNYPATKIIVFANKAWGGYEGALQALRGWNQEFCHLPEDSNVPYQNQVISWFRHVDVTDEDRARPRVLLLSFEQAAGHNLQEACHNVIIYDPMYSGTDAVADASVEEQAVGRVMRQGQTSDVTVTRIVVKGPEGETCLDDWIINRNLDEDVLRAATSNFD